MINSNVNLLAKLQTQLLKCTRYILGFKSYKMTTVAIMNKLKFMTIYHMIAKESICFIHKIIYNNSTTALYNLLSYREDDKNVRKVRKLRVNEIPNGQKVKDSIIYRSIYLFYKLDYDVRQFNPKKLNNYLKSNIQYTYPYLKIPKDDVK